MVESTDGGRESHRDLFRQVFRQSHDAIVVFDPAAGEVVDLNPAACELIGDERLALLGDAPATWFDDADQFASFVDRVQQEGEAQTRSLAVHRDGERVPTWITGSVVTYEGRECVVATIRDVAERERYATRLEALNTVSQELMTAESHADVADTVTHVAEMLLDQPMTALWSYDEDADALEPLDATGAAYGAVDGGLPTLDADTFEMSVFRAGESRLVDYAAVENPGVPDAPLRTTLFVPLGDHGLLSVGSETPTEVDDSTRHLVEVLAQTAAAALENVDREETLRAQREELVRQNERLEEFASVVSHDLRNPINVAQGYLTLLDVDGEEVATVEQIEQALERMESLVDDLLTLARQGEAVDEVEPVDLRTVATQCWGTTAHGDADLVVRPEPDRGLLADRDRLQQLLENLFRNSVEHGDADTVYVGATDGGFFVMDDGTGIPESVRDRMFESGVSTADEGTGFGLRIVESIAEAHGWDVEAVDDGDAGEDESETENGGGDGDDTGARFEVTGVEWVGENP